MKINSDAYISTLKKMGKHLLCYQPDKNLCSMLLKCDNTSSHQCQDWGSHHTIWMDNVTASTLQAQHNTFRFSPLQTPERCLLQKEVWVWCCGQCCQKLVSSRKWGMVPVRHMHHSMLTQSYRTEWRVCRKSVYKLRFHQHYVFSRFLNKYWREKMCGITFGHPSYARPQGSFPGDCVF